MIGVIFCELKFVFLAVGAVKSDVVGLDRLKVFGGYLATVLMEVVRCGLARMVMRSCRVLQCVLVVCSH